MDQSETLHIENFLSKSANITKCELALGYRVDCEISPSYIDLDSEVQLLQDADVINAPKVTRNIRAEFSKHDCKLDSFFLSEAKLKRTEYNRFSPAIRNIRYIPLTDGLTLYAVVILINSVVCRLTQTEQNLNVLADAAVTMIKAKRQANSISSTSRSFPKDELTNAHEGLISKMTDAVILFDNAFNIVKSNTGAHKLFHCSIEPHWHKANILVKKHLSGIASDIFEIVYKGEFFKQIDTQHWQEVRFSNDAYHDTLVDVMLFNLYFDEKVCFGLMITERQHVAIEEKDYFNALQRFNALTSVLPTAVLHIDAKRNCHYFNSAWLHLSGLSSEETRNKGWLNCFDENSVNKILNEIEQNNRTFQSTPVQIQMTSSDDQQHWLECSAASFYDHNSVHQGTIITLHDISESRDYTAKLKQLAENDQLTGLKNRLSYSVSLESALARIPRHGMTALLLIDLDRFKYINDTFGHAAGDALLTEVGSRLHSVVREEDTVARLGGDEFAIILTDLKSSVVINKIALDLIKSVSRKYNFDGHLINPSCSIGISVVDNSQTSPGQFQRRADIALYKAKERGRNQYCFYDDALEKDAKLIAALENELTYKSKPRFTIVYQPQINAISGEIVGMEALTRWKHSDYPTEDTSELIKKIEQAGLSRQLSDLIFKQVLQAMTDWTAKGIDLSSIKMSVNISAKQLNTPLLSEMILKHFEHSSFNPECLTLEVTETAFIEDFDSAHKNLSQLQKAGFKILLDDFGTGFSSLALLRKIPLDGIKIDRSFVTELKEVKKDRDIIQCILQLCTSLQLDSVAEGVESEGVKNWLIENGCVSHQGFYYSKPLSKNSIEKLLLKNQNEAPTSKTKRRSKTSKNVIPLSRGYRKHV